MWPGSLSLNLFFLNRRRFPSYQRILLPRQCDRRRQISLTRLERFRKSLSWYRRSESRTFSAALSPVGRSCRQKPCYRRLVEACDGHAPCSHMIPHLSSFRLWGQSDCIRNKLEQGLDRLGIGAKVLRGRDGWYPEGHWELSFFFMFLVSFGTTY